MFKWYFDLNIRTKLLAGFIWCAILAAGVGLVGKVYLDKLNALDAKMYQVDVISGQKASEIAVAYQKIRVETRDILIMGNKDMDQKYSAHITELLRSVQQTIGDLEKQNQQYPEFLKQLEALKKAWASYLEVENKLLGLALNHDLNTSATVMTGAAGVVKELENALDGLQAYIAAEAKTTAESNRSVAGTASWIMLLLLSLGSLWALGMGITIAVVISRAIHRLTEAADKLALGDINVTVDASTKDETGRLACSFNNMIQNIKANAQAAQRVAAGDLSVDIKILSEQDIMGKSLQEMVRTTKNLVEETLTMEGAAMEGRLKTRGRAERFSGSYKEIIAGFNKTLDEMFRPINGGLECLNEMAKGNLDVQMEGSFNGDHAMIKEALNSTLDSINDTLIQFSHAVDQVAASSHQVYQSSHALSQGATESASAVEQTSASMHQLASQTNQNADNAMQANKLAVLARDNAEKGNSMMSQMVGAMAEISESAKNISKIIKVIDEIAFQTNLLALNAAVEAARAGKHGKGFTVVAEEVRNLAHRSAKAAKETTEMIESSIKKTGLGAQIAEDTSKALKEIVVGATKVTDLISEIASASKEQAQGINQINQGLAQVDIVTQQNTASAEELDSAGQVMSNQAVQLKALLKRFKLRRLGIGPNHGGWQQNIDSTQFAPHYENLLAVNEAAASSFDSRPRGQAKGAKSVGKPSRPQQIISLDDDDFGNF